MKVGLGLTLGVAVLTAALPAAARGQAASVRAVDFAFTNVASPASSTVVIAPGQDVAFGYPSGASIHNVDFTAAQPAACTQTSPGGGGSVPPLPSVPTAPGWSGSCRFDAPGAYPFVCGQHPGMTGAVQVTGAPPPPAGAPAAPAGVTAIPGDGRATIAFTAPADNGAAITRYTVTAAPGGAQASGAGSPITVTGLANGTRYTFTVTATNAAGTGPPSAPSAPVTPFGAGTEGPAGSGPGTAPAGAFALLRARARAGGVLRLTIELPAAGRLAVRARFAGGTRAYGRRALTVAAAGTVHVRLRPGARARRALRRTGRGAKVDLRLRFMPAAGPVRTLTRAGVRIPRRRPG